MKNVNIISVILMALWLITFLLTFGAAIGSYQESEPHAGNILFIVAGTMLVIGAGIYLKYKPTFFK